MKSVKLRFVDVEVVRGDLTLPETLERCLEGIDTVFLVWVAPPATVAPVLGRIAKHARRIVFLSAPLKTPHPFFQQPNPSRALVEQIERLIEASGLQWTFLRPGFPLGSEGVELQLESLLGGLAGVDRAPDGLGSPGTVRCCGRH